MELTTEQYNELPDAAKPAFSEVDGVYLPVKDAALKATLDKVNHEKNELARANAGYTASESTRQAEIEVAKAEAREEAIAEAAKKGNWEEQEKLLREKFEDEMKRKIESTRNEVTQELSVKQSTVSLSNDIKMFAAKNAKDEGAAQALEIIMKNSCKLNEKGEREYFGSDGSALSITDFDAYTKEFAGFGMVSGLLKGELPTNGGGFLNGSNGKGTSGTNAEAEKAKKSGDAIGHLNAHFANAFKQ